MSNIKTFDCYYSMYYHHKGLKSSISGTDLIDAIKHSNQNAIVVRCWDEDGTEYNVRERDEVSPDNCYHQYWVDLQGNVLYDEHVEKYGKELDPDVKELMELEKELAELEALKKTLIDE